MLAYFSHYINAFLHPYRIHRHIVNLRRGGHGESDLTGLRILSLPESFLISWIFVIMSAFYSLVAVYIGALIAAELEQNGAGYLAFIPLGGFPEVELLYKIGFSMILSYPLSSLSYVLLGRMLITFCGSLFGFQIKEEQAREILSVGFASNIFLIIPIFGPILRFLSAGNALFAGLNINVGMSGKQALVTLVTPVIFSLMLGFMIFGLVFLMISAFIFPGL